MVGDISEVEAKAKSMALEEAPKQKDDTKPGEKKTVARRLVAKEFKELAANAKAIALRVKERQLKRAAKNEKKKATIEAKWAALLPKLDKPARPKRPATIGKGKSAQAQKAAAPKSDKPKKPAPSGKGKLAQKDKASKPAAQAPKTA